jgi:hypothetical protein
MRSVERRIQHYFAGCNTRGIAIHFDELSEFVLSIFVHNISVQSNTNMENMTNEIIPYV